MVRYGVATAAWGTTCRWGGWSVLLKDTRTETDSVSWVAVKLLTLTSHRRCCQCSRAGNLTWRSLRRCNTAPWARGKPCKQQHRHNPLHQVQQRSHSICLNYSFNRPVLLTMSQWRQSASPGRLPGYHTWPKKVDPFLDLNHEQGLTTELLPNACCCRGNRCFSSLHLVHWKWGFTGIYQVNERRNLSVLWFLLTE